MLCMLMYAWLFNMMDLGGRRGEGLTRYPALRDSFSKCHWLINYLRTGRSEIVTTTGEKQQALTVACEQ